MPPKNWKQNREMWVYIVVLLVVIIGLWLHFFKLEIKSNSNKPKNGDSGFSAVLQQFNDSFAMGKNIISELKNILPATSTASGTVPVLSEEQKQVLLKKIQERAKVSSSTPNLPK